MSGTRYNEKYSSSTALPDDKAEKDYYTDEHVEDVAPQRRRSVSDAVFGEIGENGPNYRNVGWIGAVVLMLKTQVGLGVLSIPQAFNILGLIPGIIILIIIAIITTWSDYVVGTFKLRHPEVYGIADAGRLMFGRVGGWVLETAFLLYWVFVAGSAMLAISIALNSLSDHATCTAVFVVVAAIVGFSLSSIQTLGKMSWLAFVGVCGILAAIFTLMIAVAIQDRPFAAPQTGPWKSDFQLFKNPSFQEAITGVSLLTFSYTGTPAFFSVISEMRDPRQYTKSLLVCQSIVTAIYLTIGTVVYYFCGSYVSSPALGSAGHLIQQICYGLALPALVATLTLVSHIPAKYIFVRVLRGSRHLNSNTMVHWLVWLGCTFGVALIAYIIASAIPVFGALVSLIGALLGTLMSFQPMGCMWIYDNWTEGRRNPTPRWRLMVCWSVFVIVSGSFITTAGTYGSVVNIMNSYKAEGGSSAWSCADNSR